MSNSSDNFLTYYDNGITIDDIGNDQTFTSYSTPFILDVTTSTITTTSIEITTACSLKDMSCDPLLIGVNYFVAYGLYLAFAVGIPGNFITCIVLARMRPFNSSVIWLIVLTFTDLVNLAIRFIYGRAILSGSSLREYWLDWACKLFYIITETCLFSSYLYVVGLTFERFIAVQFPLKMNQWCTVKRSVIGVLICLVMCLGQSMYVVEAYRANSNNQCVLREKYKDTWGLIYENYFVTTFFVLLPIILLVILNCLIVRRLVMAKQIQNKMSESENKSKFRQQKQINRMLMASSLCLIICLMPDIVYQYVNQFMERDDLGMKKRITMMNVFAVFKIYNCAVNFVLYIIAAKKFRAEFLRLVTCNYCVGTSLRGSSATTKNVSTITKTTSEGYSHTVY